MIITNEARSAELVIYYFIGKIYLVMCYFRQDSLSKPHSHIKKKRGRTTSDVEKVRN